MGKTMDAENNETSLVDEFKSHVDKDARRTNGLMDLVSRCSPYGGFSGDIIQGGNVLSQPGTLRNDSNAGLLTLDWVTLANAYAHIGIVQTLIDAPVDDAFRNGFKINSNGQLDEDDVKELVEAMKDMGDLHEIEQTLKWARLFGGSVLLLAADAESPDQPLDEEGIAQGDEIRFVSANRWECLATFLAYNNFQRVPGKTGADALLPIGNYRYNEISFDPSRVKRVIGVPAPHWIRQQLSGWGMSELERCLREINMFLKFQDMIFELVDEAKIDIYKIKGFNTLLASAQGTQLVQARIQLSNMLKNFKNALVMDMEDDYVQKQMGQVFNGLASIYEQIRMNLAAALKFPMDKLFGQSSSGLNANGEDTIENYNAIVESVRHKAEPLIKWAVALRARALFGFDLKFTIEWPALRVLSAKEQEEVNTSKQNRALGIYNLGLWDTSALDETLTKEGLISVPLLKTPELRDPAESNGGGSKSDQSSAPKPAKKKENARADFDSGLEFLRAEKRRLRSAAL